MFQFEADLNDADTSIISVSAPILNFALNDRVVVEKSAGVVRYVGPVGENQGTWVGIEWDDPARGRHNGTVDGVHYFDCTNTLASFVRPSKVQRARSVTEAFYKRYGHDDSASTVLKPLVTGDRAAIRFNELTMLDLSEMGIAGTGSVEELAPLCPNVQYLNLAENLLDDWDDFLRICACFKLKRLDLSGNPARSPKDTKAIRSADFLTCLEHLILGSLNYEWKDVLDVPFLVPHLLNLQLPFNKIAEISPRVPDLFKLKQLDLTGNQISAWDEVLKLSTFESLEYLNVSANLLSGIFFPDSLRIGGGGSVDSSIFPNLSRLNLSNNCIYDWSSVDQLNRLPKLCELRIEPNPFLEKKPKADNRLLLIANIGKLKKLEGAEISDRERRDAEVEVEALMKVASQTHSSTADPSFAGQSESQVMQGTKKHSEEKLTGTETRSNMLSLEIVPVDAALPTIRKDFARSMTVMQLQMQLRKVYARVGRDLAVIDVVSFRNPEVRFPLNNNKQSNNQSSLEDCCVENFDQLIVSWPPEPSS